MDRFSILKSGTFWFAVVGAAMHVAKDPHNPQTWGEAVAAVGAVWRARAAIAKNGEGK